MKIGLENEVVFHIVVFLPAYRINDQQDEMASRETIQKFKTETEIDNEIRRLTEILKKKREDRKRLTKKIKI